MKTITQDDIRRTFMDVGLKAGSVVYVNVDLRTIGRLAGATRREDYCDAYLSAITDIIGPEGTLVVPTYTTQVARFDLDFVWETTPTVLGTFPEYVRTLPGGLRSVHPLHSVTARGALQDQICGTNGFSDFGYGSPFQRLHELDATILTIGLESGYVVGVAHHLDAACALPYVYNKLLKWVPVVGGRPVNGRYFATVRYLDINYSGYDLSKFARHMRGLGAITSRKLGGGWVHRASYRTVFDEGANLLLRDPFWMLNEVPEFTYGRIPFDGPTAGRDGIAPAVTGQERPEFNWVGFYGSRHPVGGDEETLDEFGNRRSPLA